MIKIVQRSGQRCVKVRMFVKVCDHWENPNDETIHSLKHICPDNDDDGWYYF